MISFKQTLSYNDVYPDDKSEDLKLIQIIKSKPSCPVLKNGAKRIKMNYFFCNCTPNQKDAICESCATSCHKGHHLSKKFEYIEKKNNLQVCYCGIKCHQMNNEANGTNLNNYQNICHFYELANFDFSKEYCYYLENEKNKKVLCFFCEKFCLSDKNNWPEEEDPNYQKINVENEEDLPNKCECKSSLHDDLKKIFTNLISMNSAPHKILSKVEILNIFCKCEKSFKNIFSSFFIEHSKIENLMKNSDQKFSKNMTSTTYLLGVSKLAYLSTNCDFNYINNKLAGIFSVYYISRLLEVKMEDNSGLFNFIYHVLKAFHKFNVAPEFEKFPKLKVNDFSNMTPFYRLVTCLNILKIDTIKSKFFVKDHTGKSLIDKYIFAFRNLTTIKFDKQEGFNIILIMTRTIKKFAKFYLLNEDQILKFFATIDSLFYSIQIFNKKLEKKQRENNYMHKLTELKIVTNITKILMYAAFFYNDHQVINSLNDGKKILDKVNFIHSSNELGKYLAKDIVFLVTYIKNEMETLGNIEFTNSVMYSDPKELQALNYKIGENKQNIVQETLRTKIKKIFHITQNLISISLHVEDCYLIGLKRGLDKNLSSMIKLINSDLNPEEKEFCEFLNIESSKLESSYHNYFNHELNFEELSTNICNSLNSLFSKINTKGMKIPDRLEKKYNFYTETENITNLHVTESANEISRKLTTKTYSKKLSIVDKLEKELRIIKHSLLLNNSNYIYTVLKILKIKSNSINLDKEIFNKIFLLLYFYIEKQPENAIFILNRAFLSSFEEIQNEFLEKSMDFILEAIQLVKDNGAQICYSLWFRNTFIEGCNRVRISGSNNINIYLCLLRKLKLIKMLDSIDTLYKYENLQSTRNILKKLYEDYAIFKLYKEYLVLIAKSRVDSDEINVNVNVYANVIAIPVVITDFNDNNIFKEVFKSQSIGKQIAFKIYLKYLRLMNKAFDENSLNDLSSFLKVIISREEIVYILKIKNLDLKLRIELIRFYRMNYIDVSISTEKINEYKKEFTRDLDENNYDESNDNQEMKAYTFLEKLLAISDNENQLEIDKETYGMLLFEIRNLRAFTENSKYLQNEGVFINYLENGILLPLKIYFNKFFSVVVNLTGKEVLKIYTMTYHFLLMKKYILESKYYKILYNTSLGGITDTLERKYTTSLNLKPNLKRIDVTVVENSVKAPDGDKKISHKDLKNSQANVTNLVRPLKKNKKTLIKTKFSSQDIFEVDKDIEEITDPAFLVLDYVAIFGMVTKHMNSLIQNPQTSELVNYFSVTDTSQNQKNKSENFEVSLRQKGIIITNSKNPLESSLYQIINLYTEQKDDFKNSSGYCNLNEMHSELEVSFRNLLIKFLLYIPTKVKIILGDEIYKHECSEIILKLLKCDTEETQKAIEEIKTKDGLDLSFFAEVCFRNLLSIIFNQYNPTTIEITDDYYVSCRIIKFFKFLCEEHNNFFQKILLNELKFKVGKTETVYFYDMMIFILDKIIILSGWDRFQGNEEDNEGTNFFYALFTCLVEMLIEIIQGTEEKNFFSLMKNQVLNNSLNNSLKTSQIFVPNYKKTSILQIGRDSSMINSGIFEFVKIDPTLEKGNALPLLLRNIKNLLFNDYANSNTIFNVRKWLVDFLLAFMEEKACPQFLKILIMSSYNPQSILKSICIALKHYYINYKSASLNKKESFFNIFSMETICKGSDTNNKIITGRKTRRIVDINFNKEKQKKDKRLKKIIFNEKLYKFFTELYFKDEEFINSSQFEFSSAFYNYFKITVLDHKFEEAVNFWDKINSITPDQLNLFNTISPDEERQKNDNKNSKNKDNQIILEKEIFYVIKFFEQVSKSVTIRLPDDPKSILIVHSLTPKLYYLSNNSKEEFTRTVNREGTHTKLHGLMEQTIYFTSEIEYNWKHLRNNKFLRKANEIDYKLISKIIWFINLVINFCFLAVLHDSGSTSLGGDSTKKIIWIIFLCVTVCTCLLIILWCITKLPLNYKIEKQKYLQKLEMFGKNSSHTNTSTYNNTNASTHIGLFEKLRILCINAIVYKGEINSLLWLFVFNLASQFSKNLFFMNSVSLFAIVFISQTLKNIALSIILKKEQLAWTAVFTFMVLYIYSSWAYFYVQERFIQIKHYHHPEYVCESLLYCWLWVTNQGIRFHAGVGKMIQNSSFVDDSFYYILNRWLFDFSFFIIIGIILLHIVFGIILDTFSELRNKHAQYDNDNQNICFICSITRDECEKSNKNFDEHREKEHNVWDYNNYMITLRLKNNQDLNNMNSYAQNELLKKNSGWFPQKEEYNFE